MLPVTKDTVTPMQPDQPTGTVVQALTQLIPWAATAIAFTFELVKWRQVSSITVSVELKCLALLFFPLTCSRDIINTKRRVIQVYYKLLVRAYTYVSGRTFSEKIHDYFFPPWLTFIWLFIFWKWILNATFQLIQLIFILNHTNPNKYTPYKLALWGFPQDLQCSSALTDVSKCNWVPPASSVKIRISSCLWRDHPSITDAKEEEKCPMRSWSPTSWEMPWPKVSSDENQPPYTRNESSFCMCLTLFLASTLAPALTSTLADWLNPCQQASWRAVFPSWRAHTQEEKFSALGPHTE